MNEKKICQVKYSVVIPVFNASDSLEELVNRLVVVFHEHGSESFEVIMVDDGSTNAQTWLQLEKIRQNNAHVTIIRLAKNYGQHSAVFCGLEHAIGEYVITMDDDLQNAPEEIPKLIEKIRENYDAVFGKFEKKKHKAHRRMGTRIVGWLNQKIFNKPKNITLTNFRILSNELVKRIIQHRTYFPYIPGLILLYGDRFANVCVKHEKRQTGKSQYNARRIWSLISRILFNYSSYPLRCICGVGIFVSLLSFLYAIFLVIKNLWIGSSVPGWTTLAVSMSFFNGLTLLILGVLGEYIVRLINDISRPSSYHIKSISVGQDQ